MPPGFSPTLRRRRLSYWLRLLRGQTGLTAGDVAHEMDWAPSKLTRMERNEWKRPSIRDVTDLACFYRKHGAEIDDALEAWLVQLARESRQRGWWATYGVPEALGDLIGFEAEASVIRTVQPLMMPGLAQTEGYARAIAATQPDRTADGVERFVAVRIARQRVLDRERSPLRLHMVLGEAALRHLIGGPRVMAGQLRHLAALARRDSVTVTVVPFAAGAWPGINGRFTIIGFPVRTDPDAVYLETATGQVFIEDAAEVANYDRAYQRCSQFGLSPADSLVMISDAAERLR